MFKNLVCLPDAQEATAFFGKSLTSANAMSERLISEIDFDAGNFYLPFDVKSPAGINFSFELDDPAINAARDNIKAMILDYTRSGKNKVFIVEDQLSKKQDHGLIKSDSTFIYHGDDVYNLYRYAADNEYDLNHTIEIALQNWTVSVLAKFEFDGDLDSVQIDATPWQVDAVCVGVLDDMALLIWMPS
jgi:hypothetical protein